MASGIASVPASSAVLEGGVWSSWSTAAGGAAAVPGEQRGFGWRGVGLASQLRLATISLLFLIALYGRFSFLAASTNLISRGGWETL
jgi:hypothetical protein